MFWIIIILTMSFLLLIEKISPFGINKVIDTILYKTDLHHITSHGFGIHMPLWY